MQLAQLVILNQKISVQLFAPFLGRGHQPGLREDGAWAKRQPQRDDVLLVSLETNQPVKVSLVVRQRLMLDVSDEGTGVPQCRPLLERFVETSRRVRVTEWGSGHLAVNKAFRREALNERRQRC